VVFSQKIGVISAPVRSQVGWHIFEVLDKDTLKTAAKRDSLDSQGCPAIEVHACYILVKVELTDADV